VDEKCIKIDVGNFYTIMPDEVFAIITIQIDKRKAKN
jgi:hypothetical protein